MRIMWNTEAIQRQKNSGNSDYLLRPTGKKAGNMCVILFCDKYQQNY